MIDNDDGIDTLRVVSGYDPAIGDAEWCRKYVETRDPALLSFPGGQQPALGWYVLKPLTTNDRVACDRGSSPEEKFITALIFGLDRVDFPASNMSLRPTREVAGRMIWSQKDLDQLFLEVGADVVYEIGVLIYARSGWGKRRAGGAGSFPVPPQLLHDLAERDRRRAEQTRETATASNG
jgi:hypothetical protein